MAKHSLTSEFVGSQGRVVIEAMLQEPVVVGVWRDGGHGKVKGWLFLLLLGHEAHAVSNCFCNTKGNHEVSPTTQQIDWH